MATPLWALCIAVCFLLVAASCAWVFHPSPPELNNRKAARLGKREPLSDTEFFRVFYGTSGLPREAVIHALRLIADATGIAEGLIRPPDGLHELVRVKPWELDESLPALKRNLYNEEQKANIVLDYRNIRTVDDYIKTLVALWRGGVVPEMQYRQQFSEIRCALVVFLLSVLNLVAFLVMSSTLRRLKLELVQWILFTIVVIGFIFIHLWLRHAVRRFEFGKHNR
jgi:hypothetical protein